MPAFITLSRYRLQNLLPQANALWHPNFLSNTRPCSRWYCRVWRLVRIGCAGAPDHVFGEQQRPVSGLGYLYAFGCECLLVQNVVVCIIRDRAATMRRLGEGHGMHLGPERIESV